MTAPPRLAAAQAAARLDVKVETLYAYVSRGLLSRERDARGSTFDALEVEAFAARRRRSPLPQTGSPGKPLMVLDTDVALVEDDELYLRGIPAARLAREHPFDAVAAWLWGGPGAALDDTRRLAVPPEFVSTARGIVASLPRAAPLLDRVVFAVRAFAIADPLRDEIGSHALARVGEILLAGVPRALAVNAIAAAPEMTVPAAVWQALSGAAPTAAELTAINAAMVLSIDHDLAASTFAGRIAASARASSYAVVTAALGAFDSPLHGTASTDAARLIAAVRDGEAADVAIRAGLRGTGRGVPGFGQPLYRAIDARAAALLPLVDALDVRTTAAVAALTEAMAPTGLQPNVDLALGALTVAAGMPVDAGALVFAVARTAGWITHAIAEEAEPPLRLRPRGRYVGPL
ncbi:hypothetical protein ITJ43_09155 [Microbacterium sp. VKM Ac-2870]|uniref:citrate/2-methylcitrate synthase n=1 Tax=Microbacterium sp. VKM Ac-2870 TaxID=2783825 RepID=UPI00188C5E85|nr:citrate/2-methylcitrate synthase [Microbacterium sp. VKM Ac-2870]MBF4562308.1 hypothetical protein [Microbacterium sp. VKM Ac-2870]